MQKDQKMTSIDIISIKELQQVYGTKYFQWKFHIDFREESKDPNVRNEFSINILWLVREMTVFINKNFQKFVWVHFILFQIALMKSKYILNK